MRGRTLVVLGGLAVVVAVVLAVLLSGGEETGSGSVAFDSRSPRTPDDTTTRVLVQLQRPSLGERLLREKLPAAQQQAYVKSLVSEARALEGSLRSRGIALRDPVEFARTWTGFAATVRSSDLPKLETLAVKVEPVRRFYPAAASTTPAPSATTTPGSDTAPSTTGTTGTTTTGTTPTPTTTGPTPTPTTPAPTPQPQPAAPTGPAPPAIALLDSSVAGTLGSLRGRVVAGYDAASATMGGRPPRAAGHPDLTGDRHGTELAGILAANLPRSQRILAIRVAAPQLDPRTGAEEVFATTDQLLLGLEHAVDPNGNGDVTDHVAVALVGVNSPYAGFTTSPEAEAVNSATNLGTLVVAPAGNEGPRRGSFGTIGSPGAASGALTVAALEGRGPATPGVRLGLATKEGRDVLDGRLLAGRNRALSAPVAALVGPSQADPGGRKRAPGDNALQYYTVDAAPRARGRVVVLPATGPGGRRPSPAVVVATAATAGARAVVICDPHANGFTDLVPRGAARGITVVYLTGDDAQRALDLTQESGGTAFISKPEARTAEASLRSARASSQGATYGLTLKPDLAAPGTAIAPLPGGGRGFVSGTSVAAARVSAMALRLHLLRRADAPEQLAGALVGTALPTGAPLATGAGQPSLERAGSSPAFALPYTLSLQGHEVNGRFKASTRLRLRNPSGRPARFDVRAESDSPQLGAGVAPASTTIPPGGQQDITLSLSAGRRRPLVGAGRVSVHLDGGDLNVPFVVATRTPPPPRIGPLRLDRKGGQVTGVRFNAGSVRIVAGGVAVDPIGGLVLELQTAGPGRGRKVRELTPEGGAIDLLPGEYSYTLTRATLRGLGSGSYRFFARARGPAGGKASVRRSSSFRKR